MRMLDMIRRTVRRPPAFQPNIQPAPGKRSVTTLIGARRFEIASDDNYLEHIKGSFEPSMVQLFSRLVRPGDVVLDVGANIGCTALLFGQLARRVIAFEPSPSTFRLLEANLAAAAMRNVTPVNLGLGREAGAFDLTFSRDNRSGGFVSNLLQASSGHEIERIEIAAGDAWLREAGVGQVDFIKIDVEGFERNVIEGLHAVIARDRPLVVLELNHWCLNVLQRTSVPEFLDFLRSVFPLLYAVDNDGDVRNLHDPDDAYHVMYHHVVNNFRYPNLVGAFDAARVAQLQAPHV